eukprot:214432-Rhodomonas_salina.3
MGYAASLALRCQRLCSTVLGDWHRVCSTDIGYAATRTPPQTSAVTCSRLTRFPIALPYATRCPVLR